MLVLGVESSCDETAIALVENGTTVLSSTLTSQIDTHAVFGGVVPEIAAREHLKAIYPLFKKALLDAGKKPQDIDLIAVTQGPGLIGALLVGVSFAKGLASFLNKPLIPVDHVHAHVHGAILGLGSISPADLFPSLSLVVSGGHTNLYYMPDATTFHLMATTIDDACGECFDKVGKLLKLSYPGGPIIEKLAKTGDDTKFEMPHMVQEKARMQFSYSGLKTHMVNLKRKHGEFEGQDLNDVCASFQKEALGQIIRKIKTALKSYKDVKCLIVAGGVSANQKFREMVGENIQIESHFPDLEFCSDNAAMIAAFGWHEYQRRKDKEDLTGDHDWDAYSRYDFAAVLGHQSI